MTLAFFCVVDAMTERSLVGCFFSSEGEQVKVSGSSRMMYTLRQKFSEKLLFLLLGVGFFAREQ